MTKVKSVNISTEELASIHKIQDADYGITLSGPDLTDEKISEVVQAYQATLARRRGSFKEVLADHDAFELKCIELGVNVRQYPPISKRF